MSLLHVTSRFRPHVGLLIRSICPTSNSECQTLVYECWKRTVLWVKRPPSFRVQLCPLAKGGPSWAQKLFAWTSMSTSCWQEGRKTSVDCHGLWEMLEYRDQGRGRKGSLHLCSYEKKSSSLLGKDFLMGESIHNSSKLPLTCAL